MRKTDAFRRAAALLAALSITVSLAAPAFAGTYYIDKGNITVIKNSDGTQTIKHGDKEETEKEGEEIIITTSNEATTTLESDLEGPAAEDSGFGPVVEDNYQPAAPAQPEDAEEPKDADQPEDDDQKKSTEESEDANRPENAEESEDTDREKSAEEQESAGQQPQPQQAAPTSVNGKGNGVFGNTITVINNAAKALKLTLKDVKIDVSNDYDFNDGKAALSVQGDGNVTIELDGKNELKSGYGRAGLEKNTSKGTLTLKDDKEPGSLKAEGGTGAAGIGGSENNGTNNITISGGTVKAIGGPQSAGIGGGNGGGGDHITITGGTVTAEGGPGGAGIGSGGEGDGDGGSHITITGGTVNAIGGYWGAGIGGGGLKSGNDITITGGTVTAEGGTCGAGIGGGGWRSGSGNITVSGAAQVTAVAGKGQKLNASGSGATIGDGYHDEGTYDEDGNWFPGSGKEVQVDINGLTTGYIHHIIYDENGNKVKEWWEPERPQPNPEDPNAPAEESNGVSLGTPGLHVETLEGVLLPFDAQQQGRTLTVTSDTLAARLHGTREALAALQEQGVEQIQFVTSFKTTTLSVEDLLAEGGSRFALEHNGPVSRLLSAAQAESLKCRMR
mgnify:CR=1 FL=1